MNLLNKDLVKKIVNNIPLSTQQTNSIYKRLDNLNFLTERLFNYGIRQAVSKTKRDIISIKTGSDIESVIRKLIAGRINVKLEISEYSETVHKCLLILLINNVT